VAASLADGPEGYRVPGEIERDLIRLTSTVMTADGDDRKNGTVYAA
jgi:hypothetical protein